MKIINQLLFLLFISFPILGQDNSTDTITSKYSYDFSEIWLEPTYQGVIGIDNQRIQVKFLTVKKDDTYSNIYIVTGKAIVHDNNELELLFSEGLGKYISDKSKEMIYENGVMIANICGAIMNKACETNPQINNEMIYN